MFNDLIFSANVILPIFFLIILGYFLTRIKLWDAHFLKVANDVAFKCLLPVLLFYNVATANIYEVFDARLIIYACGSVVIISIILMFIIPKFIKEPKRRGVMIQGIFRSNFLLFGIPLGESIGGANGAILAAVVASFYVPIINMLATITLYNHSERTDKNLLSALKGIITNPLIIGGVSGLLFSLFRNAMNFEIPTIIDATLFNIKSIATPFAFMILGGDLKFDNLFKNIKVSIFAVLGRIVIIPAIMIPLSMSLGFNNLQMAILMAIYATPNAVSSYAMARNYGADYELSGEIVVLSTIFSVITMFIVITLCKSYNII